jgi:hypothetical protein
MRLWHNFQLCINDAGTFSACGQPWPSSLAAHLKPLHSPLADPAGLNSLVMQFHTLLKNSDTADTLSLLQASA